MIPTLRLLQSFDDSKSREERAIDRSILVDVAPDREELLTSNLSIDDIRQEMKLHVSNPSPEHWLYRTQRHENAQLTDATIPLSVFDPVVAPSTESEAGPSEPRPIYVVERVPNAPSTATSSSYNSEPSYGISNEPILLKHTEALVSPRELGATHLLIVYSHPPITSVDSLDRTRRHPSIFSEALELPINDLIFLANVPNLSYEPMQGLHSHILPRRLPNELPRVLLPVPNLTAFPELVVYLHTRNQAGLFRALIPDWARDVMHPLPLRPMRVLHTDDATPSSLCCRPLTRIRPRKLNRVFNRLTRARTSPALGASIPLETLGPARTVDSVGAQLAEAAANVQQAIAPDETLRNIVASLDALRDNLNYVGYYKNDLWAELLAYRRVALSAISHQARVLI